MEVTARFFAVLRERTGSSARLVQVAPGATVATLWDEVVRDRAELGDLRPSIRFAVNGVYAAPDTALRDGDEVAFLPPMSGGRE